VLQFHSPIKSTGILYQPHLPPDTPECGFQGERCSGYDLGEVRCFVLLTVSTFSNWMPMTTFNPNLFPYCSFIYFLLCYISVQDDAAMAPPKIHCHNGEIHEIHNSNTAWICAFAFSDHVMTAISMVSHCPVKSNQLSGKCHFWSQQIRLLFYAFDRSDKLQVFVSIFAVLFWSQFYFELGFCFNCSQVIHTEPPFCTLTLVSRM